MVFRALRPIPRGREVLSNYDSVFEGREARQKRQRMFYGFVCGCEACEVPSRSGFWARSDERRRGMVEARRVVRECERVGGEGSCADACAALERLEGLLVKEGLVGLPLADTYRGLVKWAGRMGDKEGVKRWRMKELEVCEICLGRESVRARELRMKLRDKVA